MNSNATEQDLKPWLAQTQQALFRELITAFSYPGRIVQFGSSVADTLIMLLATLVDSGTTLADPFSLISHDDRRRLNVQPGLPERARFLILCGTSSPEFQPALGSLESPEEGATLIVCVQSFDKGEELELSGPGIDGVTALSINGIDPSWWIKRRQWNISFPMGVDLILVAEGEIVAIPRTTKIQTREDY